eukprot:2848621-Pyramimonas_sp.AAC.1
MCIRDRLRSQCYGPRHPRPLSLRLRSSRSSPSGGGVDEAEYEEEEWWLYPICISAKVPHPPRIYSHTVHSRQFIHILYTVDIKNCARNWRVRANKI